VSRAAFLVEIADCQSQDARLTWEIARKQPWEKPGELGERVLGPLAAPRRPKRHCPAPAALAQGAGIVGLPGARAKPRVTLAPIAIMPFRAEAAADLNDRPIADGLTEDVIVRLASGRTKSTLPWATFSRCSTRAFDAPDRSALTGLETRLAPG
jgi:hypothetical protein